MDYTFFSAINGLAGKWHWLDAIGKFFGGDYFLYLFALAVAILWFNNNIRNRVYLALVSVAVGRIVIVEILKRIVDRPRPYEAIAVRQLIADNEHGVSFPSGHSAIYFALAFAFWGTKYFWPFFFLAVAGSVARVFVGVHYPFDILAGALIGGLTALLLKRLFKNRILG